MKIDVSRLNLLEKDIEDWLYENPGAIDRGFDDCPITEWIGRQYQLPSGIADLIGVRENKRLVVIEVKNVPINKAAVLQVCRYQNDLKHIVSNRMDYPFLMEGAEPYIEMILVGPSIDAQTFTEARAVGVTVIEFSINFDINLSSLDWTREHINTVRSQQDSISVRPEWDIYGLTIAQDYNDYKRQVDKEEAERYRQEYLKTVPQSDEYDRLMDAAINASKQDEEDDPF